MYSFFATWTNRKGQVIRVMRWVGFYRLVEGLKFIRLCALFRPSNRKRILLQVWCTISSTKWSVDDRRNECLQRNQFTVHIQIRQVIAWANTFCCSVRLKHFSSTSCLQRFHEMHLPQQTTCASYERHLSCFWPKKPLSDEAHFGNYHAYRSWSIRICKHPMQWCWVDFGSDISYFVGDSKAIMLNRIRTIIPRMSFPVSLDYFETEINHFVQSTTRIPKSNRFSPKRLAMNSQTLETLLISMNAAVCDIRDVLTVEQGPKRDN